MTGDTVLLLGVLAVTLVLFVSQVVRIEVTSLGLVVALPLLGLVDVKDALSGFASTATLTVGAMLVLSAALERAGVVDYVARLLSRGTGRGTRGLLVVLAIPTIGFSAFINNTPVVALMIPVALTIARRAGTAPSKLLLPISYFSILGGTCTLFGTSTNILVDALYRDAGGAGLGVFEFTPLGLVYVAAGFLYVVMLAPRFLPERTGLSELLAVQAPGHFVTEVTLRAGSKYAGRSIGQVFPAGKDVVVLEVVRGEEPLMRPALDFVLAEGDVLFVDSTASAIYGVLADKELERGTAVADEDRVPLFSLLAGEGLENPRAILDVGAEPEHEPEVAASRVDLRIAEAVVTPTSRFVGRRIRRLGLTKRHGVQVLAIRRLGRQHQYQLRDLRVHAGDVLLVQGEPAALRRLGDEGDLLLVEGVERTLTFPQKAPLALGILVLVVALAAVGAAPIVLLALGGVGALLLTRCLYPRDVVNALEPDVLLLLAGTIPLGVALQKAGLAEAAGTWLANGLGHHPWLLVAGFYLLTSTLTEMLSNNATAVLLTPIALAVSTQLGIDPKGMLMAVAFGSSASFSTPIGYQTNTLVMGPGGYRFVDYLRFGLPLNFLLAVVASLLIPLFFPFA